MPSPEAVFSEASSAVLPGWLLLVLAPRWRHTTRLVCAVVIPGLLAFLYAAIIAARWGAPTESHECVSRTHRSARRSARAGHGT